MKCKLDKNQCYILDQAKERLNMYTIVIKDDINYLEEQNGDPIEISVSRHELESTVKVHDNLEKLSKECSCK